MLARINPVLVSLAVVALIAGCANKLTFNPAENMPPEIRLEPAGSPSAEPGGLVHTLRWSAVDPDGRVDHFLVSQNPRSIDAIDDTWRRTSDRAFAVHVRTADVMAARDAPTRGRDEPTIVAVRAVDDRGATSLPALRAYFAENIAPTVTIVLPRPGPSEYLVPQTFRIKWVGSDPDGPDGLPIRYKFKLFDDLITIDQIRSNPDVIRQLFAPTFAGWDSVPAESTATTLRDLVPGRSYAFSITALDDSGGYDPIFRRFKNILFFRAVYAPQLLGPRLTMYSEFFNYTYPSGEFFPDSGAIVHVACPPRVPLTFRWFAQPVSGAEITGYRWVLDPSSLDDTLPRRDESRDFDRWSQWSLTTTSATVGPFHGQSADREHTLYIEAADTFGLLRLGTIRFHIVQARFDHELLIVDDTRFMPDLFRLDGQLIPPQGPWPGAAELDSFLFARGGFPWRAYPAGTLSSPGLFEGYGYDTLGTRTGQADPTVPLELLLRYRKVVWITDGRGATYTSPGSHPVTPITALRAMCGPGRGNPLGAYVERGGRLWIVGGGGAVASTGPFDRSQNNSSDVRRFTQVDGELVPGRFMYDLVHWRSAISALSLPYVELTRSPFPIGQYRGAPAYSMLPASLAVRSPATDPLPPVRAIRDFYYPEIAVEALVEPNSILENRRHDVLQESTLDTLIVARATRLPTPGANPAIDRIVNPVMTLYHGSENGSVVFTGFDLWSFSRPDMAALVDAVLQGIWGLPKGGQAAEHEPPGDQDLVARGSGAPSSH